MSNINIKNIANEDYNSLIEVCPFNAIEYIDNKLLINSACKMCRICIKRYPDVFELIEDEIVELDKSKWKGISVYVEHNEGIIHNVTYELLGKAKSMAKKVNQKVYAIFIGYNIKNKANELLNYGADEVLVYDSEELKHFRIEPYAKAMENFINIRKPSIVLVGGTTVGRALAPRVAARFRTGLTADCTSLEIQENSDLDQIRPAFGGNIMAHIHTPNHRPQFATVRYKIFDKPEQEKNPNGKITLCKLDKNTLKSKITILETKKKEHSKSIEDAEIVIVAGRGVQSKNDLKMIYDLADKLDADVASTRPLIEASWTDPKKQIGLSGRTVKPKLIITCGVSGAIQFVAGMQDSAVIIAINKDKDAPIFKIAHYCIIGDIYEIVPTLSELIKNKRIQNV